MAIAEQPSKLSLPITNPGVDTILQYLIIKFPFINSDIWQQRMLDGKVHFHDGTLITAHTRFQAQQRIYYYREVESEPCIPFKEKILFQDQHILVAYKPHFLPVTPGGVFINECLQNRLRLSTGIIELQALHRLDRVTAGLVMFSVNPDSRHSYHQLFKTREINKSYQAIANINTGENLVGRYWQVENNIQQGEPRFRMQIVKGIANSHSQIRCIQQAGNKAMFELTPITGRTHQLRVHMQTIGWPILNDKYYPDLQPLSADNYALPLQLLAKKLEFIDPITHQLRYFSFDGSLSL
jgi:tRNA pseudouridine32 synthase/23S rRNA pseudouridine746 synthase